MRVVGLEPDEVESGLPAEYWQVCRLAEEGRYDEARRLYDGLEGTDARLRALIQNDLAALAALEGRYDEARRGWQQAMEVDPGCRLAGLNDVLVAAEMDRLTLRQTDIAVLLELAPAPGASVSSVRAAVSEPARTEPRAPEHHVVARTEPRTPEHHVVARTEPRTPVRVAVVSLLFNWPSTGGGNMHTAGLARFLGRAGTRSGTSLPGFQTGGSGGSVRSC